MHCGCLDRCPLCLFPLKTVFIMKESVRLGFGAVIVDSPIVEACLDIPLEFFLVYKLAIF